MSNRVVDSPEIEAKKLFLQVIEGEAFLFDYFLKAIGHQMEYLKKIICVI